MRPFPAVRAPSTHRVNSNANNVPPPSSIATLPGPVPRAHPQVASQFCLSPFVHCLPQLLSSVFYRDVCMQLWLLLLAMNAVFFLWEALLCPSSYSPCQQRRLNWTRKMRRNCAYLMHSTFFRLHRHWPPCGCTYYMLFTHILQAKFRLLDRFCCKVKTCHFGY